ncbi:hypothetical protein B0I35DRAFT_481053 [Stachybotrys elegans]|uniref:Uncharacterized protein n=1 Tax=Stachybotrys elegans TaxID=80388 RepID=A0A8K0SR63_9HYPO|nr:hypothetical protein B0I35DRAFT_481053 [Stachybotrys elegans]
MSPRYSVPFLGLAIFNILNGKSSAQSFGNNTIVGCDVVDCPLSDDSVLANCQVVNETFVNVGIARIPFRSESPLDGLSWTEGVEFEDGDEGPIYDTRFYLGAPPTLSLGGLGACALFFRRTSDNVFFRTGNPNITEETQGVCEDALSQSCISALNRRALDFEYDFTSVDDACSSLGRHFLQNFDDECEEFAVNGNWSEISVTAIAGQRDLEPISAEQNSTSNCWPVVPKSHELIFVESFREEGDSFVDTIHDKLFGIHPILTVFFPRNSTIITSPESHMTCLKTLSANDGRLVGDQLGDESSASLLSPSKVAFASVISMAISIFWL